tara:strand:- start:1526 stop:1720 length:195 start_codon:yes stop_codon:yes gene_type:complete
MSSSKKYQIKNILLLNLIIGIHNIINFSINGYWTALIIGIINVGVWALLRDMKLMPILVKIINK